MVSIRTESNQCGQQFMNACLVRIMYDRRTFLGALIARDCDVLSSNSDIILIRTKQAFIKMISSQVQDQLQHQVVMSIIDLKSLVRIRVTRKIPLKQNGCSV